MAAAGHIPGVSVEGDEETAVYASEGVGAQGDIRDTELLADHGLGGGTLEPLQRRAYGIIHMFYLPRSRHTQE